MFDVRVVLYESNTGRTHDHTGYATSTFRHEHPKPKHITITQNQPTTPRRPSSSRGRESSVHPGSTARAPPTGKMTSTAGGGIGGIGGGDGAGADGAAVTAQSPRSSSSSSSDPPPSRDLFEYLATLPPRVLRRLYAAPDPGGPCMARAVLQRLPELGGQFALRLAACGGTFPLPLVRLWTDGGSRSARREADASLAAMAGLGVIEPIRGLAGGADADAIDGGEEEEEEDRVVRLTPEFGAAIQASLSSLRSAPWEAAPPSALLGAAGGRATSAGKIDGEGAPPTANELETFTQKRWDSVLHFLVGSAPDDVEDPPAAVVKFLEQTGLMQEDPDWNSWQQQQYGEPPLVITARGYEFMLQDVRVQVWQFILQYFQSLENHKRCDEIRAEALLFLVCLSFCRVGDAFPAAALSAIGKTLMRDFSQFGLLYVAQVGTDAKTGKERRVFFPTRVAVNLVAGGLDDDDDEDDNAGGLRGGGGGHMGRGARGAEASGAAVRALEAALVDPRPNRSHVAIIVQTNFQLAAYTTSQLHLSMIGLFCDITNYRRLPNVIFYQITRESVKGAFKLGIEAGQILRFLRMHAHPHLRSGDLPLVPPNVEDQICLWDRERHRVRFDEVCHVQCRSKAEYRAVAQYSVDLGAFAWGSDVKLRLLVRFGLAERTLAFIRRWRTREAQRKERDGLKKPTKGRRAGYD